MEQQFATVRAGDPTYAGQAVYTRSFLRIYDPFVLGLSNRFIYRCPSSEVLGLYDRHVSAAHLDIGPGTGYFLNRCRFPVQAPELTLVDLNEDVLAYAAHRLRRYAPRIVQADILRPLPVPAASVDSIGLNYVLHCVPGPMREKAQMFGGLAELLTPGGVLFGSTALGEGQGVSYGRLGRRAMTTYNGRGILSNAQDNLADLRAGLDSAFPSANVKVRVRGTVALFTAVR